MNGTDDENTGCWGYKMPPEEKRKLVGPQYIATKVVNARLMTLGEFNEIHPGQMFKGKTPEDEGYQVTYPQIGTEEPYQGWCPKAQFEAQNQNPRKGMSFGHALEMMRLGYRVKRLSFPNEIWLIGSHNLTDSNGKILEGNPLFVREFVSSGDSECATLEKVTVEFGGPVPSNRGLSVPRLDREGYIDIARLLATDWVVVD